MARRVIILPSAARDLHSLYTYIRDRSGPEVAIGFVRRIRAYCEGFETIPERGRRRDDLRPGLRLVGFERRVVIAFTVTAATVEIGRILYGGRDVDALLGDDWS
jgi:toxin ParE1/3/4